MRGEKKKTIKFQPEISDHICCILLKIDKRNDRMVCRTFRYITEETLNTFYDSLVAQNWSDDLFESKPNILYDVVFETILSCYETTFPLQSRKPKKKAFENLGL